MHGFLLSWWLTSLLKDLQILGETLILVRFYSFDCLGCFLCYRRKLYGFYDLRGLHSSSTVHGFLESWMFVGFSYGVDCFLGKPKFWFGFMISIVLFVFGSGMDSLWIY